MLCFVGVDDDGKGKEDERVLGVYVENRRFTSRGGNVDNNLSNNAKDDDEHKNIRKNGSWVIHADFESDTCTTIDKKSQVVVVRKKRSHD